MDIKKSFTNRDNGEMQYMDCLQTEEKFRKKLLLLGTSTDTNDVLAYCKENNIETIITDYNTPDKNPFKNNSDGYWMLNVTDIDALEARCKAEHIDGIYTANNEFCMDNAKILCKRLHMPFFPSDDGWKCARDKMLFKRRAAAVGLPVPELYDLQNPDFDRSGLSFPLIVKPVDSSASQGITICYEQTELPAAEKLALSKSGTGRYFAEQYIVGSEYNLVLLLADGEIVAHAYNNLDEAVTDCRSVLSADYFEKVRNLMRELDITEGAAFLQFFVTKDGRLYFLELANRMDGAGCWHMISYLTGYDEIGYLVSLSLSAPLPSRMEGDYSKRAAKTIFAHCMPGKIKKIIGLKELKQMDGVRIVLNRFKAGDVVDQSGDMMQIAFYLVILAEQSTDLIQKIQKVKSTLHILDENGKDMLFYSDVVKQ